VTQLPANATPLTVDEIRMFLQDQPESNPLTDDIEFPDKEVNLAIKLTLYKFNAMTPQSNYSSPSQINGYLLLCGVCCILLRSEGIRQMRNQVMSQDGNIAPVGLDEKQELYAQWAERFCQEFIMIARAIKTQDNMEAAFGGSCSGYRNLGRFNYSW
jgi:hypothetical protein